MYDLCDSDVLSLLGYEGVVRFVVGALVFPNTF